MIYDYIQLQNLRSEGNKTPLERYLHKFLNQRKEIRKLKTHEKDYLFHNMSILRDENDKKSFDIVSIKEASEYNFYYLILTYSENLDFDKPTQNYLGQIISRKDMEDDKVHYDGYFTDWKKQLESSKGRYCSIIYIELNRRLKELNVEYEDGRIDKTIFDYQTKYLYTVSFFIYYKVKLFFDGMAEKYILLKVFGENIVINIYSFVHILFRHYFPSMDIGKGNRSINTHLPFLDINNLPLSLYSFITKYFSFDKTALTPSREYLLFSFNSEKHII